MNMITYLPKLALGYYHETNQIPLCLAFPCYHTLHRYLEAGFQESIRIAKNLRE